MKTAILEAIKDYYGDDAKDVKVFEGNRLTVLGLSMIKEIAWDKQSNCAEKLLDVARNCVNMHVYSGLQFKESILQSFEIYFNAHPRGNAMIIHKNLQDFVAMLTSETDGYRRRDAMLKFCTGQSIE